MSTPTDTVPAVPTGPADAAAATRTEVRVERADGRVRTRTGASGSAQRPLIRPMVLSCDDTMARISLVPEGALLLAGDAVCIDVYVGPGALLDLQEPAGTVAYDMRGGHATWDVRITLAAGASLLWGGEPFVVSAGADVRRRTLVTLGEGARLALRETVVLGRHGEEPGRLHQELEVVDQEGFPVLVEALDLDARSAESLLGPHHVIGSALLIGLGSEWPAAPGNRFDLEAGGVLLRRLTGAAHTAHDAATWDQVVREICS
jgi:urease accessory protein